MSDTTTKTGTPVTNPHAWTHCHDDMHVGGDSCPTCNGYMMGCRDPHETPTIGGTVGPGNAGEYECGCGFALSWPEWTTNEDRATMLRLRDEHEATHQTSSTGSAKTDVASVAVEARTPGAEVEHSPAPSRPAVNPTDRITYGPPFAIERTITNDDIHLVTFALTDDAVRQLARDLERHSRDLITLWRLMQGERRARRAGFTATHHAAASRQVMDRIAGALTSHATTQWELTLTQAEQLLEDLDDAATEPETCIVGTCTGYASAGSYCSGHADGI